MVIRMGKIIQRHNECIGCGACVALDSENFEMDGGQAKLKNATESNGNLVKETSNLENAKNAANACPVKCIEIEE
ncbi:MAG: ferredoxin [Candidatus ainarchaeum sp.]|nr:ferredoxin [Candidatus ainarchaeum sp.]